MLTINNLITFLSTLPVRNNIGAFKTISELFLQMSGQVYYVPGKSEGKKEGLF